MRVKLTEDVKTTYTKTAKGGYSKAEINYEGAKKPFQLVSFSNPAVFDTFKDAKAGEVFEVDSSKGDDGFYKWTAAKKVTDDAPAASTDKKSWTHGPDPRETPEERSVRQRLIVRQSSLAQAIAYHGVGVEVELVLSTAERFTAWVYEAPDLFDQPSDIPF